LDKGVVILKILKYKNAVSKVEYCRRDSFNPLALDLMSGEYLVVSSISHKDTKTLTYKAF
jgi:hypothetical protein